MAKSEVQYVAGCGQVHIGYGYFFVYLRWPETCDPHASVSQMFGSKVHPTTPDRNRGVSNTSSIVSPSLKSRLISLSTYPGDN